jgi:hypothetical protein
LIERRLLWGLILIVFAGVARLDFAQPWSTVASFVVALVGLGVALSSVVSTR